MQIERFQQIKSIRIRQDLSTELQKQTKLVSNL